MKKHKKLFCIEAQSYVSYWSNSPVSVAFQVNRSSSRGFTALHAAAENGQVPVMPLSGRGGTLADVYGSS